MAIVGARHGLRGRGTFSVGIEYNGEWIKFKDLINSLDTTLTASAIAAQKEFAEIYCDKVKENIDNGGEEFHYPPLSEKYKKLKSRFTNAGMLNWSRSFHDSVIIKPTRNGKMWEVGIPKEATRPIYYKGGSALPVSEYANVLEHGMYPEMPARPIFRDTLKQLGGKLALKKIVEATVIGKFGSKGIRVNKI